MPERMFSFYEAHEEIKRLQDRLSAILKINQDNVENALSWRRKYLEADGRHHEAATRIVALEQVNQHNVARLSQQVKMFENSEASTISDLQSQLEEARKSADVVKANYADAAHTNGSLRVEIYRKDKDLQLLRSELERARKLQHDHRGEECHKAYLAGLAEGQACQCPRTDIALEHRVCSGEFLHRAIDLHDLLREVVGDGDKPPFQFRVKDPTRTGEVVALVHALRDFHAAQCPSNEG